MRKRQWAVIRPDDGMWGELVSKHGSREEAKAESCRLNTEAVYVKKMTCPVVTARRLNVPEAYVGDRIRYNHLATA